MVIREINTKITPSQAHKQFSNRQYSIYDHNKTKHNKIVGLLGGGGGGGGGGGQCKIIIIISLIHLASEVTLVTTNNTHNHWWSNQVPSIFPWVGYKASFQAMEN